MTPLPIYHIATKEDYNVGQSAGFYTHESLKREGFIHCSTLEQVIDVANAKFHGRSGLVLLKLDASRIRAEVRYENLEAGEKLFPHIYGVLDLDAIIESLPFEPSAQGEFDQELVR